MTSKPQFVRFILLLLAGLVVGLAGAWLIWQYTGTPASNPLRSRPAVGQRGASVVYLAPSREPELWLDDLSGADPRKLTDTGGRVFDFAVSPNGENVAYSRYDDQGGISLWTIDRAGSAQLLLDCGQDWCINPDYSPDGGRLAYSRRTAGVNPGSSPGLPRVWILKLDSGKTNALYADPNVSGSEPSWSPDGNHLVFYDGLAQGLRLANLTTHEDTLLASEMGMTGEWTPDGLSLYFNKITIEETQGYETIYRYALSSGEQRRGLGEDAQPLDYGPVAIAPQGDWLAVGIREAGGSPARQLWLMRLDGSQRQPVTSDPLMNVGAYRWSPDGDQVAYQGLELGSSNALPFVVVWTRSNGESRLLAENASRPQWVP